MTYVNNKDYLIVNSVVFYKKCFPFCEEKMENVHPMLLENGLFYNKTLIL